MSRALPTYSPFSTLFSPSPLSPRLGSLCLYIRVSWLTHTIWSVWQFTFLSLRYPVHILPRLPGLYPSQITKTLDVRVTDQGCQTSICYQRHAWLAHFSNEIGSTLKVKAVTKNTTETENLAHIVETHLQNWNLTVCSLKSKIGQDTSKKLPMIISHYNKWF